MPHRLFALVGVKYICIVPTRDRNPAMGSTQENPALVVQRVQVLTMAQGTASHFHLSSTIE